MNHYQLAVIGAGPVSYTHLDVYKRQVPTISTKKTIVSASSILTHPLSCYYFIRFACHWQRRKKRQKFV